MRDRKVRATARVRITLDIAVGSAWGTDCTVEQIHKQAREEAIAILRGAVVIDGLAGHPSKPSHAATVVGEPKVTAVLVDEEEARDV